MYMVLFAHNNKDAYRHTTGLSSLMQDMSQYNLLGIAFLKSSRK